MSEKPRRRSSRSKPVRPPIPFRLGPILIGLAVGVILVLLGGYVYVQQQEVTVDANSTSTWLGVGCRVDKIAVAPSGSPTPIVGSFSFDAAGERIVATRITIYSRPRNGMQRFMVSSSAVQEFLQRYRVGSIHQCRFNPKDQSEVILGPNESLLGGWALLGPGLLGLGGLALLLQAFRIFRLARS